MADDATAVHRARGATAVRAAPTAVFDVPAAHGTNGATPVSATLVATAAVLIGVAAHQSTMLAYFATFAVSLVPLMRAVTPEEVDRTLVTLDACLWLTASLARAAVATVCADLEADLRRARDAARGNPVLAPAYARAEERARVARAAILDGVGELKRWTDAKWAEHKDDALAVCFLLRLTAVVIYMAATVLIYAAYEEAKIRVPAVLNYLRGVVKEIRSSPHLKPLDGAVSSSFNLKDAVHLGKVVVYLMISTDMLLHANAMVGFSFYFCALGLAMCGFALLVSQWLYQPDDSDETGTTGDMLNTANYTSRRVSNGGEATQTVDLKVRESWNYLWFLIVTAHFVDVCLLRVTLGPRPVAVALLALCNTKILNVGKEVQLTQDDDGEQGADGSAEPVVNGGVNKWRRAAMAVLAASSAKVLAICVVLSGQLAALSFVSLCVTTVLLLVREESLADLDASGEDREEGAGLVGDIIGGAEEEADEVNTTAEEASAVEEHRGSSEEHVEEQRQDEPDYGSNSSMEGWDFVEVDPEMPIDEN